MIVVVAAVVVDVDDLLLFLLHLSLELLFLIVGLIHAVCLLLLHSVVAVPSVVLPCGCGCCCCSRCCCYCLCCCCVLPSLNSLVG